MIGDEPIAAKLTGKNNASKPFADVINQIVDRVNRPVKVKVEYYGVGNQQSSAVYSSKEDVTIVIRLPLEDAGALDIYQDGSIVAEGVEFLNFIGATVEQNGTGADVTVTGGGGSTIEKVVFYKDTATNEISAQRVSSYDTILGPFTGT